MKIAETIYTCYDCVLQFSEFLFHRKIAEINYLTEKKIIPNLMTNFQNTYDMSIWLNLISLTCFPLLMLQGRRSEETPLQVTYGPTYGHSQIFFGKLYWKVEGCLITVKSLVLAA